MFIRALVLFEIVSLSVILKFHIVKSNDTYHPCLRNCEQNVTMVCKYEFTLEHFVTMARSCDFCDPHRTRIQLARNPDCQCAIGDGFERGVLTINRMIPGPSIQVCKGDTIIVDVVNLMEGMDTTIHWHGLHQYGSQYYDGVPFVTQCPIHGGNTFRYKFKADKAGTHFYHSHSSVQKLDGLYGSFVVRIPREEDPHVDLYDNDVPEHTIVISDFLHTSSSDRIPGFTHHDTGQYPETLLLNGRGRFLSKTTNQETDASYEEILVKPDERYRLRLINALGTTCDAQFIIEKHTLTVLSSDGDDLVPFTVDSLVSYSGERYDVVIETNQKPGSYWIQVHSEECYMKDVHQIGILRYENLTKSPEPLSEKPTYSRGLSKGKNLLSIFEPQMYRNACDGARTTTSSKDRCIMDLRSIDQVDPDITKPAPDISLYMPYELLFYEGRQPFVPNTYKHFILPPSTRPITGLIDGISFAFPPVPPLSQPEDLAASSLCNSRDGLPPECKIKENCTCSHTINLRLGDVLEMILVDYSENRNTSLTHPFHLHGHSFHVLEYGQIPAELAANKKVMDPILRAYYRRLKAGLIVNPPAKDTILIPHNGYAILRVKLYNPGYWFFHCHFAYHIVIGMNMILHVGEITDLPEVPKNFPRCGNFLPE